MENIGGRFKLNDYVTYRKNGVCQIVDVAVQNFGGQGKKEYYELKSVYDQNIRVFVPLGSELEKEMQYALSVDEIHSVIERSCDADEQWIDDCKARAWRFDDIVNSGDKAKMIWLIRAVTDHKVKTEAAKKKMKANDLKYLAQAEAVISAEFAYPLGLQKNEVMAYIKKYSEK